MGTRGLVRFYETPTASVPFVAIYRQFDGYAAGLGGDLKRFDFEIVNGFSGDDKKQANGMSCLAAQVVAGLKAGIGNVYLVDASLRVDGRLSGHGAAYIYELRPSTVDTRSGCGVGSLNLRVLDGYGGQTLYDGTLSEYEVAS